MLDHLIIEEIKQKEQENQMPIQLELPLYDTNAELFIENIEVEKRGVEIIENF